ncbi:hypothetical protein QMK33_00235 [Hymenobacter sp. H14-R3]|uniref:hypothetical protein n=1 Tax=Hymenobacter sp. H14-R3 TaxID=3046308 RepID=UPI0024B916E8|nr:hypothetical protein [Hymenobacter sp. H14-R3]MDJ0363561.1 hypothetical protein [Hymenobacter sp. H14-R3]
MARTIPVIKQSILDAIAASPILGGLLISTSAVSVFGLLAYVVAFAINVLETIFDRHMADVDAKLAAPQEGTTEWYAKIVKLFQQGDQLVVDDDGIHYPAGSSGLLLVTQATAKENDTTGRLFLKVATDDATAPGGLRSLTAAELVQVRGYITRRKYPGTKLELVSREADALKLGANIYYDPLVELNDTNSATGLVPGLRSRVASAITSYLRNLKFDGQVVVSKLEDAIQAVVGVEDLEFLSISARNGLAAPKVFTRAYETEAGYVIIDTAAGATLADTLNFVPYGS